MKLAQFFDKYFYLLKSVVNPCSMKVWEQQKVKEINFLSQEIKSQDFLLRNLTVSIKSEKGQHF